ncbi:SMC family ATPase [Pseudarthrobacter sulfonivorans]|uniref:SMC family ATPase n=1 Tax=Pseudarthrobacter sulfonivorans TaxID=121292 RepID=UPI002856F79D|nr:SMC family ATPase [Pseudarthrobacter sulfonivorans]MDR6413967.1 exonuclease SbcC [Pseudarthrobacter sulfonivorans]
MRIHRLTISAFGPFAGTEEVDFDRLSAHGLFLLNGPTGAGKTSVLDAVCFALYGSVPGARQEGKRLRSDHAEPALEPSVTCEFSAQGRHFEVTRSPAWDKPSARGKNGFTTQQAKTLLRERVGGAWTDRSGRNDEAGAEITALLGMDREQFTRVVMLPQGDFAAFLRSKASDRLELLQKLFGTQRFEALELELSAQAQAARNDVAKLNGELELLAARAEAEASALAIDDAAPAGPGSGSSNGSGADAAAPGVAGASPEEPGARIGWLQAAAARRAAELSAAAEAAALVSQHASGTLESETARRERQRRLAAAKARKEAAEATLPSLEVHAARLEQHRRAELLTGQLQAVQSSETQVRNAAGAMESAVTLLRMAAGEDPELEHLDLSALDPGGDLDSAATAAGVHPVGSVDDVPALNITGELGRIRSLLAVVEARLPDEERLQALGARRTSLATQQQELTQTGSELVERLGILRAEQEHLTAGLKPLEVLASAAVLHSKEAAAAEELLDVVRQYTAAVTAQEQAAQRHSASREIQLETKARWLDLREERLANAAAELAAQLAEGDPCPVCGSQEHPAPAQAGASALGLSQAEEAAQHVYEEAEAKLAALNTALGEANQLVAVLAGQGGDTPEDEAVQAAAAARHAAGQSQRAVQDLADLRKQIEAVEARIAAAETARNSGAAELAQVTAASAEVADNLASLDQALSGLRGGHRSLTRRLRSLQDAAATLEKAEEARDLLEKAKARAEEARLQLERALPESGFGSAGEARAQLLAGSEAAALQAKVRAGHDEQARIAELFASEELRLALNEAAADPVADEDLLAELQNAAATAGQEARDADLAAAMAARCAGLLATIRQDYEQLAGTGRGPREHALLLTALADTAAGRGENTYRMSLNSYVLAARLEQVALAASERLVAMSDGRYLLQHSDARAARGAKSGLGLEVVDQWTGHRRDTSTLSGGESFMASLSLALGLADVVQQESGGIQIDTLFVDEGFGSLDEQSLEQVMDALEGLRDGGRVVGLVSHVGEMKQRIGTQLQVLKGRDGSTLRISDAAEVLV